MLYTKILRLRTQWPWPQIWGPSYSCPWSYLFQI